jgi:hypothetical protein
LVAARGLGRHSVEILLKIYAKCLDGGTELLRQRVQAALGHGTGGREFRQLFASTYRRDPLGVGDNRTFDAGREWRFAWSERVFVLVSLGAPGRDRQTWETAVTSDNCDLIIVEGRWPLQPRGQ